MWTTFRTWLDDSVYSEPLERHQAGVLQIILLIIVVASIKHDASNDLLVI